MVFDSVHLGKLPFILYIADDTSTTSACLRPTSPKCRQRNHSIASFLHTIIYRDLNQSRFYCCVGACKRVEILTIVNNLLTAVVLVQTQELETVSSAIQEIVRGNEWRGGKLRENKPPILKIEHVFAQYNLKYSASSRSHFLYYHFLNAYYVSYMLACMHACNMHVPISKLITPSCFMHTVKVTRNPAQYFCLSSAFGLFYGPVRYIPCFLSSFLELV